MPDISVTVTITDKENDMLLRLAAVTGGQATNVTEAESLLSKAITDRTHGELETALVELRQNRLDAPTKAFLKRHIDSL